MRFRLEVVFDPQRVSGEAVIDAIGDKNRRVSHHTSKPLRQTLAFGFGLKRAALSAATRVFALAGVVAVSIVDTTSEGTIL
jgi:hypothetical protein